jgi:uncharacterized ion transporter superfamily protein YfcC
MMKNFSMPHTLVLMFILMVLSLVITWIVPSGSFETTLNEHGQEIVVPGTYSEISEKEYLNPLSLFTVVPRAMGDAQAIIFFVLIIGGAIKVIRETGAIDAFLGSLIRRYGSRPNMLLFSMMFTFAMVSATIGVAEEYIPFALILVSLCVALRLDAIAAIGTLVIGYGVGYGIAFMNPFTLVIAQNIAGLQPLSGYWYRLAITLPFIFVGFHHVWSYTRKIQADPSKSLMRGVEQENHIALTDHPQLNRTRKIVLLVSGAALLGLIVGIATAGWYLVELSALFLGLAVVIGLISGMGANKTAIVFGEGAAELTTTALLIGFARSIALLMEDGMVLHTVVQAASAPLSAFGPEFAAVGMLFIQSVLNFFIPSGSGQAFVSMPLMAPIGDIVGVSRQISVLAFQFGDGLMNMIVPTSPVLMGILGLAGIPYTRWFRFIAPLIVKMFILASFVLVLAVWIGYE